MPLFIAIYNPPALATLSQINTLEETLNTQPGFEAFYNFLKKEYALENLLFWREVGVYHAQVNEIESQFAAAVHEDRYALICISQFLTKQ